MSSICEILANSGISFGTSGARGLVSDFSDEVCAAFAQSFVNVMQQSFNFESIAFGIDNRPSSPKIAAACIGALKSIGYDVEFYGVLPTPALAYQAMLNKVPAVMITGSHIPFDRNGLKFYRPDGEITKEDEYSILTVSEELKSFIPFLPDINSIACDNYIQRYLDFFPKHFLVGKRVGIYEHSSSGRDLYYKIFTELGADVTPLGRTDTFVPIDTEAVNEADQKKGINWSNKYHFDLIFSTDGDGDRPLIADENGEWLRGDIVGLLCAKALGIDSLALPVSCNTVVEQVGLFSNVVRTKIGSPYVIEAFSHLPGCVAGFEANGGFILGSDIFMSRQILKALPTRDALLPGLALLYLSIDRPLSQIVRNLPTRYTASDRLQSVPILRSQQLLSDAARNPEMFLSSLGQNSRQIQKIDLTDGLRFNFVDGDIVHLRASGNAPELRCYAESNDPINAKKLVTIFLMKIDNLLN